MVHGLLHVVNWWMVFSWLLNSKVVIFRLLIKWKIMTVVIKKGDSKEHMDQLLKKVAEQPINPTKKFEATKYSGTVKFKEDPLEIQKKMRDEWE